jgi:hypothetical protein
MQQLNDSRYIPSWVQAYMRKTTLMQTTTTSRTYHPFKFRIYHENTDKSDVDKLLKQIKHLKRYFTENIMDLGTTNINIVFILSKKVKMIDKTKNINKVIDKDNINSGVCIHSSNPKDVHIIIYRKEDLMKVLFHEIIHYIGADLRFYDDFKNNNIEMMIQAYIPSLSNIDIYFNEAFTEALARYHYTQFSKQDLGEQQEYSIEVVKKFLALYNCRDLNEFSKLKKYNEKSHAFSYIVIASALLNSDDFIQGIIVKGDMNDLENIVYKSLLQKNKWFNAITNTNEELRKNKKQKRLYLKLSI